MAILLQGEAGKAFANFVADRFRNRASALLQRVAVPLMVAGIPRRDRYHSSVPPRFLLR
jgi:hypothetical protein